MGESCSPPEPIAHGRQLFCGLFVRHVVGTALEIDYYFIKNHQKNTNNDASSVQYEGCCSLPSWGGGSSTLRYGREPILNCYGPCKPYTAREIRELSLFAGPPKTSCNPVMQRSERTLNPEP